MGAAHLLVVEDDADIAAELGQALVGHGFTVTLASTCAAAAEAARQRTPELVLLDWGCPTSKGWRCAASSGHRCRRP